MTVRGLLRTILKEIIIIQRNNPNLFSLTSRQTYLKQDSLNGKFLFTLGTHGYVFRRPNMQMASSKKAEIDNLYLDIAFLK